MKSNTRNNQRTRNLGKVTNSANPLIHLTQTIPVYKKAIKSIDIRGWEDICAGAIDKCKPRQRHRYWRRRSEIKKCIVEYVTVGNWEDRSVGPQNMSMLALKLDPTMIVRYITTATMTVHWVGTHNFDISKLKNKWNPTARHENPHWPHVV